MPAYDYQSEHCSISVEITHGMHDTKPLCPECGHDTLTRVFKHAPGVIFKGPGFFATDYRTGD